MKRLIVALLLLCASAVAQTTGGGQNGTANGGGNVTGTGLIAGEPVQGNGTVNILPAGGQLWVTSNGLYTTLCSALNAIAIGTVTGISDVYDYNPERGANAWTKDPFNDSTCGNNSNNLNGLKVWMARGTWMTQYPVQQPSSVEVIMNGRGTENQVNAANAVGGTLVIACNTAAPWTTTFAMSCPSSTNFPGGIISSISRSGTTVTVNTTAAHNYTAAMASAAVPVYLTIANVTGATNSFNGNFVLASVPSSTQLTYTQSGATESGTVSVSSAVASPVWSVGNAGLGNNDFAAVLRNGTISSAGIPGSITLANHTDQERGIIDQVTLAGWQTYCMDISAAQAQNFDFTHIECITGSKTGATIGMPTSAICVNWEINGPSRGFNSITCNPRGTATVGPILADIRISGTQGGSFINEHMENAQYQYLVTASEAGVASRDIVMINGKTGSTLQGQNISTIARAGTTVTVTTANPTGAITGEKTIIASAVGGLSLALTSVNGTGVYQGTITGGAANAMVGQKFNITGFVNGANNLTESTVTASTATALTFSATTVIETHAGTAASTFSGTYSSITVISSTSYSYTDTSSVTDSGTTGTETLGGMATFKICGTGSTVAACRTGANSLKAIAMGSVRISPSIVLDAVEDDVNSRTITSGTWNGSYFEAAPDLGVPQTQANGGTGASALNGTDTGTSSAYVVTGTPIVALTNGIVGCFTPANANVGSPTVAFNGLAAKTIVKYGGFTLVSNDIVTTQPACVVYNGTNFLLLNPQGVSGTGKIALVASPAFTGTVGLPTVTQTGLTTTYNNVTTVGMGLVPVYGVVSATSQTAAISTATLCLAASCGNGSASQYHVHWNFSGSGTACSSVTAGSVTFLLTWTDENAVTHTAVALQMMGQTGAATEAMGSTFPFQTALANESASGDFTFSTNGTIIQYATGYTACTTGTGTYNLRAAVTRLQ